MELRGTLAHLSDLHFGLGPRTHAASVRLVTELLRRGVGHVVVTGDITHRGRTAEYAAFLETFAPLLRSGQLTVIPGNHDCPSDNVAAEIMPGARVQVEQRPGIYFVKVNSTGPHNRVLWQGHGLVGQGDLEQLRAALDDAPPRALVVVLMHHHPYPLPEEGTLELLSSWAGLPFAAELASGAALLDVIRGRADLLLHGHRHVPSEHCVAPRNRDERPLWIYNAGSSPELGRFRVFRFRGGRLHQRWWQHVRAEPVKAPRAWWIERWVGA